MHLTHPYTHHPLSSKFSKLLISLVQKHDQTPRGFSLNVTSMSHNWPWGDSWWNSSLAASHFEWPWNAKWDHPAWATAEMEPWEHASKQNIVNLWGLAWFLVVFWCFFCVFLVFFGGFCLMWRKTTSSGSLSLQRNRPWMANDQWRILQHFKYTSCLQSIMSWLYHIYHYISIYAHPPWTTFVPSKEGESRDLNNQVEKK